MLLIPEAPGVVAVETDYNPLLNFNVGVRDKVDRLERVIEDRQFFGVINSGDPNELIATAYAVWQNRGIPEPTCRVSFEATVQALKYITTHLPDVIVGAGSARSLQQYRAFKNAGAHFVVFPITPKDAPDIANEAKESGVPAIFGFVTLEEARAIEGMVGKGGIAKRFPIYFKPDDPIGSFKKSVNTVFGTDFASDFEDKIKVSLPNEGNLHLTVATPTTVYYHVTEGAGQVEMRLPTADEADLVSILNRVYLRPICTGGTNKGNVRDIVKIRGKLGYVIGTGYGLTQQDAATELLSFHGDSLS